MTSFFRHTVFLILSMISIFSFIFKYKLDGEYSVLEDVLHTNPIVDFALFLGRNETKKKKVG
jgi:hypothetical protein